MSESTRNALQWLKDHNGDGVFMRGNVVLAAGEVAPFRWVTWKSLIAEGKCEAYQVGKSRRIRVRQ